MISCIILCSVLPLCMSAGKIILDHIFKKISKIQERLNIQDRAKKRKKREKEWGKFNSLYLVYTVH